MLSLRKQIIDAWDWDYALQKRSLDTFEKCTWYTSSVFSVEFRGSGCGMYVVCVVLTVAPRKTDDRGSIRRAGLVGFEGAMESYGFLEVWGEFSGVSWAGHPQVPEDPRSAPLSGLPGGSSLIPAATT